MADEREKDREEKATPGSKERSATELDTGGLDAVEIPEGAEKEEETTGEQKEQLQKGGIGKREYIIICFSLLLFLISISGSVFIWARYITTDDDGKGLALSVPQGPVCELKPFFVPLPSNTKSKKFVRLALALELCKGSSDKQIAKRIEEVRSNIFIVLLKESPQDIENVQGREVLAEKIISIVNLLFGEKIVAKVFFRDVVVL